MPSGLFVSIMNADDLKLENVNLKEKFDGLKLRTKYGFDLGWYILWNKIHVILKFIEKGETEIYLADNEVDGGSILGQLVKKVIDDSGVDEKDQKELYNILKKHSCCYF